MFKLQELPHRTSFVQNNLSLRNHAFLVACQAFLTKILFYHCLVRVEERLSFTTEASTKAFTGAFAAIEEPFTFDVIDNHRGGHMTKEGDFSN